MREAMSDARSGWLVFSHRSRASSLWPMSTAHAIRSSHVQSTWSFSSGLLLDIDSHRLLGPDFVERSMKSLRPPTIALATRTRVVGLTPPKLSRADGGEGGGEARGELEAGCSAIEDGREIEVAAHLDALALARAFPAAANALTVAVLTSAGLTFSANCGCGCCKLPADLNGSW